MSTQHEFPQVVSFFQDPPVWIKDQALDENRILDFAAMGEVVFSKVLPLSKLGVTATRDGEFCIDFTNWPAGFLAPGSNQPSDALVEAHAEASGKRNLVVNAFLCCVHSCGIPKNTFPRLGRVIQQAMSQKWSLNDTTVAVVASRDRLRTARGKGSYANQMHWADNRIGDRVTVITIAALDAAVQMLDTVAFSGVTPVRQVAFYSNALVAHSSQEFTESLILNWSAIESFISELWNQNKAAHSFTGNDGKAIYKQIDDLEKANAVPVQEAADCQALRLVRNDVIHSFKEADHSSSKLALQKAEFFFQKLLGLQFHLADRAGIGAHWTSRPVS